MKEFKLDPTAVAHAEEHPFPGCFSPRNAAYGRVAEPMLVKFGSESLGVIILPFDSPLLPTEYKKVLGIKYRHDGLVFAQSEFFEFLGVLEAKLEVDKAPKLSIVEQDILKYCKDNNLQYFLSLGKMLNKRSLTCSYNGCIILTDFLNIITYGNIDMKEANKHLIY